MSSRTFALQPLLPSEMSFSVLPYAELVCSQTTEFQQEIPHELVGAEPDNVNIHNVQDSNPHGE